MTLIGRPVLLEAAKRNAPLRKWLALWIDAVESSHWHSLSDVRRSFPSADGVRLRSQTVVTVFNVKGNRYRLLTIIDYDLQVVEALELLSHPEYDRGNWKQRY